MSDPYASVAAHYDIMVDWPARLARERPFFAALFRERGVRRVLDVGCATGFSLIAAGQRGWEAEGIECSEFCVQYARSRGLTVHHGSLRDYPGKEGSLDAITMWDYLEHSPDPLGDLRASRSLLKPGGITLLSIPNVDSWSYRLLGKKWIGFT